MTSIFVSYRREDDSQLETTITLVNRLRQSFSSDSVFWDLDLLSLSEDFSSTIETRISESEAMIVVIGPTWLTARDWTGGRRLENQNDFVRLEIESAFRRSKRVVPVLVNGAEMPRAEALPASLRALTRQNAIVLRSEHLEADTRAVITALIGEMSSPSVARSISIAPTDLIREAYDYVIRKAFEYVVDAAKTAKVASSKALTIVASATALALFGWQITKSIPDIVDFANAFLSDRAQVDRLLNFFLGTALVVSAATGARILYTNRQRLIAATFSWLTRDVYRTLGSGFVEGPIDESVLRDALPSEYPNAGEAISEDQTHSTADASGSAEDHLRRASAWASHLK